MGQNSKALTIRDFFPPILWGWKIGEFFQKKANLDECGLVSCTHSPMLEILWVQSLITN